MIEVIINGKKKRLHENVNISDFLCSEGYEGKLVAVAVNGDFVAKSEHKAHMLKANDEIEIVAPMQGG